MADILDEVNDEIRQEKIANFWKDHGTFIVICVIAVIVAVAGKSWWMHHQAEQNRTHTGEMIAAINSGSPQEMEKFINSGDGAHQMLARLIAAGEGEDTAKAVKMYRDVAADSSNPDYYRDLAMLLAVGKAADMDDADTAALINDLKPLTEKGRTYRPSALELTAHLEAGRGDYKLATEHLQALLNNTDMNVPPSLRARAEMLVEYYALQAGKPAAAKKTEG